ncbi:hypothetical protein [Desemzia sp. FAM 23989]|uniref:hypothetical protein n=1 Tax=Desemzia sp. FAM 23989 TaxID=3259523 RepID=UPI00388614E1
MKIKKLLDSKKQLNQNLNMMCYFVYFKKETLPLIKQYLDEGSNPDAPDQMIPYLLQNTELYTYVFN